jgi:thioredoxin reductase (NADPH)
MRCGEEHMVYDLIIVGAGPAGCSAALTAKMRNLSVMMLYWGEGALEKAKRVDNYPGLPETSGRDIVTTLRDQAAGMGAEVRRLFVQKILPLGQSFSVLAGNDVYEGKTILLACGTARVQMLEGEEALVGSGVSYCATCDGMFFKGKQMIVIAGGDEAVEEANFLADLGHVQYFSIKKHDISPLSASIAVSGEKPVAISREAGKLVLTTDVGKHEADGIFILRPTVAMTQLLPEVETENNYIKVDHNFMTNVPGVFAAGDMTGLPLQAAKAVGEGNVAALAIAAHIRKMNEAAV